MDDFKLNLHLLEDALAQKTKLLEQILSITENQQTVLESPCQAFDFFKEMNKEKQTLIDGVLGLDEVFQSIYNKIGGEFEARALGMADEAAALQAAVKTVCDLDIKIRLQEDRNSGLRQFKKAEAAPPKPSRNRLLGQYAKNNKFPVTSGKEPK